MRAVLAAVVALSAQASADGPCCKTCPAPLKKYYSVVTKAGHCGEACIDPKKFAIYKIFEHNLTAATDNTPCAEQTSADGRHYTHYDETETHSVPGLIKVQLDMYSPGPALEAVTEPAADQDAPCCKTCTAPRVKYFSVDVAHGYCGECCMDPAKFNTYHTFEKNLTRATDNTPCSEQWTPVGTHYTEYSKTVTHGIPGVLSMTLDLYAPGSKARSPGPVAKAAKETQVAADGPCCKTCTAPLVKYFSVDAKHGNCGECCMDPAKFNTYHTFEKNLTRATDNTPCSEQWTPAGTHYTQYSKTVTHGIPGVLSMTLDLYAPGSQA